MPPAVVPQLVFKRKTFIAQITGILLWFIMMAGHVVLQITTVPEH